MTSPTPAATVLARKVVVRLSYPPRELSPNARVNRWRKAKAVKAYRREAWVLAHEAVIAEAWYERDICFKGLVTADVEFTVTVQRGRDEDNLRAMLKPAFDGFVDAGLLVDDNARLLRQGVTTIVKGERDGVVITLTEAPL